MAFKLTPQEQVDAVRDKRYRVRRTCVCTYEERANGWGCCCSWPIVVTEDPEGMFRLTVAVDADV